jgi:hypothetical protein
MTLSFNSIVRVGFSAYSKKGFCSQPCFRPSLFTFGRFGRISIETNLPYPTRCCNASGTLTLTFNLIDAPVFLLENFGLTLNGGAVTIATAATVITTASPAYGTTPNDFGTKQMEPAVAIAVSANANAHLSSPLVIKQDV